jgi:ABC-type glycerol-3-phosphate transport system substrate-binding protein
MIRRLLIISMTLLMIIGLVGCTKEPVDEEKTLTIWFTNAFVSEAEQKLPQADWYLTKVAKAFEAANPGVTIEYTVVPDASAAHQSFKAAAMTDSGPDIVNLWSGQYILSLEDILLDITSMVPADDKTKILGWETVTTGLASGGKILGYPTSGQDLCGFVYNKLVLTEAGLDFETNPPTTPEELMAALEKIKAIGKLPIVANDGGWNGAYFMSFANWWVQTSGSASVASNSEGTTKFAEDQGFLESYQLIADMYEMGYINQDYTTLPSPDEVFLEGNTALLATGNWAIGAAIEKFGEENVGFYNLPDMTTSALIKDTAIGGPGQGMVINKKTKYPELAVEFLSFLNNRENHLELLKNLSKLPIRTDISLADLGWTDSAIYTRIYDLGQRYVYWADNSMIPDVTAEMQKLGAQVITGTMTVEEMAQKLDEKAAELAN